MNEVIETQIQGPAERLRRELDSGKAAKVARLFLEILGGAIPVAGGVLSAGATAWSEREQASTFKLIEEWLRLQQEEIREIGVTLAEVLNRLDLNDPEVDKRIHSPEYQSILRKVFRDWAGAESEVKREAIRNLLCAAASSRICPDDVVKLFVDWIHRLNELHFRVIREIYSEPMLTRAELWDRVHGVPVREDSAEADLFKLLISELSIGHVIRQVRETDSDGRFLKQRKRTRASPRVMTSAFEDGKEYVLTSLGEQFARYTMSGVMPKLAAAS